MNKNLKKHLDELVLAFEAPDFVGNDPIQFPHRFKHSPKDAEISGLIASSLAFGKREKIIEAVEKIHLIIQNEPRNFCENYTEKDVIQSVQTKGTQTTCYQSIGSVAAPNGLGNNEQVVVLRGDVINICN